MQRCHYVLFALVISLILGVCLMTPLEAASLNATQDGIPQDVWQQIITQRNGSEKALEPLANEISFFYAGSALWQATRAACGNGDYVYAYQNLGLQVIDFSDPAAPRVIGEWHHPASVDGMIYHDGFVYVSAGYNGGILIVDVSDPYAPVLASSLTRADGVALDGWGVEIIGTTAYMSAGWRVLIVDISDPYSPQILDILDPGGVIHDAAVVDNFAYLANGTELEVWDISGDPTPALIGRQFCNGDAYSVAGVDDLLYVANRMNGLYIFRSTSYGWPSPLGSWLDTTSIYQQVETAGHYAYLTAYDSIKIIDVQTPSAPVLAADWVAGDYNYSMSISGDKAYLADWYDGASRFDISAPASPVLDGRMAAPGMGYDLVVAGNYAYEANGTGGLQVLDISDPESPVAVASYDTPGPARAVALVGDAAYLSDDSTSMLTILDMTDPLTPIYVGNVEVPYTVGDIVITGDFAYMVSGDSMLAFDISDPLSPVRLSSTFVTGSRYLAVQGNYAYVSVQDVGLQVVDISNPSSPQPAGTCPVASLSFGLGVVGDYVYLSHGFTRQVSIIDVSDPDNPTLVVEVQTPQVSSATSFVHNMQLVGNHLYMAAYLAGLLVYNVDDPTAPVLAGVYSTWPLWAYDLDVIGGNIYLACDNGFMVLRQADCNGPDGVDGYDIGDAVYLIQHIFAGGPGPDPFELGDVNCDGYVDIGDAVYIIDFIFRSGSPPCGGCF